MLLPLSGISGGSSLSDLLAADDGALLVGGGWALVYGRDEQQQ